MSNQKVYDYLKEIADRCEVSKKMTFHSARHTFATTVILTNSVHIETVNKMLLHNVEDNAAVCEDSGSEVSEDIRVFRHKLNIAKSDK